MADPSTASERAAMVAGSSGSRRVARSTRVRCSRTSRTMIRRSASVTPIRCSTVPASSAPVTLWSCDPGTLPMSWSTAASMSRSGRATSRTMPLAATTVSMRWRSTVCRCTALRCGRLRTASPLGDPPLDDAREVEALPHRDEPGARREQVGEEVAGDLRPGLRQDRGGGGEVLQRRRREGYAAACGHDGGAQRDDRVGRQVGGRPEDGLAVVPVEAVAERCQLRTAGADPQGAGALGLHGAAQGAVDGIRDGACRRREVGEEVVGVGVAEQRGARVLVVAGQPVPPAPGDDVDGVTHVEDALVGLVDLAVRPVGQPRGREGPQHRHVAEAAVGLLEVRLDEVGEVALAGVALDHRLVHLTEPGAGVGPPVVRHGGPGRVDDVGVPGHVGEVEQPDRRGEVVGRDGPALGHRADTVVEPDSGVPDRVPELVGEGADLLARQAPWVVDEHQVVVAERSAVAAGERPDRGEGDSLVTTPRAGLAPELLEPPEPELRERPAAGLARAGRREGSGAGEVQTS